MAVEATEHGEEPLLLLVIIHTNDEENACVQVLFLFLNKNERKEFCVLKEKGKHTATHKATGRRRRYLPFSRQKNKALE